MNWTKNIAISLAFLSAVAIAGSVELSPPTGTTASSVIGTSAIVGGGSGTVSLQVGNNAATSNCIGYNGAVIGEACNNSSGWTTRGQTSNNFEIYYGNQSRLVGNAGTGAWSTPYAFTASSLTTSSGNVTVAGGTVTLQHATSYLWFSSASGGGSIDSNVSAANASNTAAGAAIRVYPDNALDSTDYVFSVGNAANAASLFAVGYNGTIYSSVDPQVFNNSIQVSGNFSSNAGVNSTSSAGTFTTGSYHLGTKKVDINTAPTVVACSGTAASVTGSNGTASFVFDVGTSCTGESTAVLTLPAASTGWVCRCDSTTADRVIQQKGIGTTTSVTMQNIVMSTGANGDFTDGADLFCGCRAY